MGQTLRTHPVRGERERHTWKCSLSSSSRVVCEQQLPSCVEKSAFCVSWDTAHDDPPVLVWPCQCSTMCRCWPPCCFSWRCRVSATAATCTAPELCAERFLALTRGLCVRGAICSSIVQPASVRARISRAVRASLESDCALKWIPPRRRGSPPGVASLRERDSLRDDVSAVPYIRIARALTHSVLRVRRTQCLAVPKAPTAARTRGRQLRAAPSAAPARATKRWSLKW